MTTGPQVPASGDDDRPELEEEPAVSRSEERGEEQERPQGGRPGMTPIGPPYGGSADVPDEDEGLPGEWESHEVHEQRSERPQGPA